MTPGNRLRVLFLPKWYPNYSDSLDGIFVVDHAKAASIHHDVTVLFIHSNDQIKERRKVISDESKGFREITVYFRKPDTRSRRLNNLMTGVRYLSAQFAAYRQLKKSQGKPDLVHVHVLCRSAILAWWLKKIKGIPYLVTEHWSGYDPATVYRISPFKRKLIRTLIRNSKGVLPVSEYLAEKMKQMEPHSNYTVVPNCINEDLFKPATKKSKRLVHVSTLDDYPKNFGNLFRVIARVAEIRSDFELIVIGKGVEKDKQVKLADELGILNKVVFFKGYLEKEKVADEIAQSEAMLLFSHHETQSCVAIEALMCGVPVIGTRVGGLTEIVNDKNGILVAPGSINEMSEVVLSFLNGDYAFDQDSIRDEALKFSHKSVGAQLDLAYKNAMNDRS